MKRALLFLLLGLAFTAKSQQFTLFGTKTLYDGFENPARKIYTQDTSRQFSFNFFLPNIGINLGVTGDGVTNLQRAIVDGVYSGSGLDLGHKKMNRGFVNANAYLAMFRIYTSVLRHGELGFSWQVRSDTYAKVTNETLAILDSYKLFDTTATYYNTFNSHVYSQAYHQFSVSYRENLTRELGVGIKLSLLSGIDYASLDIDTSSLGTDYSAQTYGLYLGGHARSSFALHDNADNVRNSFLPPLYKNPGMAVSAAFNLKQKDGWTLYGQLKDIGFIRWRSTSRIYSFSGPVVLATPVSSSSSAQFGDDLDNTITSNYNYKSFIAPVNGKAEFFITKEYEHYRATAILSKNLFYEGGDFGLLHNFSYKSLNLGINTVYSLTNALQVGAMGLIKTYGFEIFMGSDQLFKSYKLYKGTSHDDQALFGSGYAGTSIFFGIGINFGRVMEHPWFSNRIPGF